MKDDRDEVRDEIVELDGERRETPIMRDER